MLQKNGFLLDRATDPNNSFKSSIQKFTEGYARRHIMTLKTITKMLALKWDQDMN